MNILDLLFGEERAKELSRIYGIGKQPKREIRHTAVGWKPDDSYVEDCQPTASREREFYRVEKKGQGK